jgi:Mg2+ and Co2+ transporter CorA
MPSKSFPTFRLPYANNRGGVLLPQLLPQRVYSIFENLKSFFQHSWHLNLFFRAEFGVVSSTSLVYLLARSLWESNVRFLDRTIRRISFEEIRRPSLEIYDMLHDLRENLAHVKTGLVETITYASDMAKEELGSQQNGQFNYGSRGGPLQDLQRIHDEAIKLEVFLMETFQLLMSSISVQDSQASIEQTRRSIRLTQLAFIYVPLSFVTGIFGMNIKELNGSVLNIWAVFVCVIAVALPTAMVFLFLHYISVKPTARRNYVGSMA